MRVTCTLLLKAEIADSGPSVGIIQNWQLDGSWKRNMHENIFVDL